jgi:hypothetical protein
MDKWPGQSLFGLSRHSAAAARPGQDVLGILQPRRHLGRDSSRDDDVFAGDISRDEKSLRATSPIAEQWRLACGGTRTLLRENRSEPAYVRQGGSMRENRSEPAYVRQGGSTRENLPELTYV